MPVRFQVDPDFYDHPKTAGMSDAAFSLWVRAGSFSAAKLTDGFIAETVLVHTLRSDTQVADELVERGLWRRRRGGYVFHEWNQRNLTRQRVRDTQNADAKRKREERSKSNGMAVDGSSLPGKNLNDQLINIDQNGGREASQSDKREVRGSNVRPDTDRTPVGHRPESDPCCVGVGVGVKEPSGYVDLSSNVDQRARHDQHREPHEIPPNWKPHDTHRALATQRGLNIDHQAELFRSHARDKGRTSHDWHAAFSSWLGRSWTEAPSRHLKAVSGDGVRRDPKTGRVVESWL